MKVDAEVRQAIELHPGDDVVQIAKDVSAQTGRRVPVTLVVRVRGNIERNVAVSQARDHAAGSLGEKVDRIESASGVLEKLFHDETLPLKERIEASKELRQWTKLGMDAAGIHDKESDTLFVVEGEWDMTPANR